jgi:hypothetical protein
LARGKKMPPARAATEGMAGDSTASPITCSSSSSSRYGRRQRQALKEQTCAQSSLCYKRCAGFGVEMVDQLSMLSHHIMQLSKHPFLECGLAHARISGMGIC